MNKRLTDEIKARYELVSKMEKLAEEKLKSFPEGRIKIKHSGNHVYYYQASENANSFEKYIPENNKKLIDDLIQKGYIKKVLSTAKTEKLFLNKIIEGYPKKIPEDIYEQLCDDRKNIVKPIILTDEQFIQRWQESRYTPKAISSDTPVFITMNGEHVRSKSEMIIADRLLANGIPYKYECPLVLRKENKTITIHPDFSMLRLSDRKTVYYEHCGKMDDPEYTENNVVKRINDYSQAGIVLGDTLFLTFESSTTPLDVRVLDELINKHFK